MRSPISGTFELSPLCNMDCRMCYIKMTKDEQQKKGRLRTNEEWLQLAREAKDAGLLFLLLTGGEPFLVKSFKDLYIELTKMGLCVSINTNGTMIDEGVIKWLKQYPPTRINLTLYGASDDTYNKLCRNPKGFTQVKKAIYLLKENNIQFKLNCSITPYNKGDLKAMIDFANENDLVIQIATYMFPPLRKDKSNIGKNDRLTSKEAAFYNAYTNYYQNGEESFRKYMESGVLEIYDVEDDCYVTEGDSIKCRAGISSFWITWQGNMIPCGMLPSGGINPWEVGFKQAWEHTKESVNQIKLPVECAACAKKNICKACAAMVYTETGTYDKVPQYRCEMTNYYPEACKKVLKELEQQL